MADVGINFRGTAGLVSDGTGETHCIGDLYPTTRGGATFGWETNAASVLNRDSGVDRRLAGVNFAGSGTSRVFRIDLDATGDHDIRFAGGDTGGSNVSVWDLEDNTTQFAVLNKASGQDNYIDATGVTRTEANWPTLNAVLVRTFASQIFRIRDQSASNNVLAHVRITQVGGGGGSSASRMALLGVG